MYMATVTRARSRRAAAAREARPWLLELPEALLEHIARQLRPLELGRLACTSRACRATATSALPDVVAREVAQRLANDKRIANSLCHACPYCASEEARSLRLL